MLWSNVFTTPTAFWSNSCIKFCKQNKQPILKQPFFCTEWPTRLAQWVHPNRHSVCDPYGLMPHMTSSPYLAALAPIPYQEFGLKEEIHMLNEFLNKIMFQSSCAENLGPERMENEVDKDNHLLKRLQHIHEIRVWEKWCPCPWEMRRDSSATHPAASPICTVFAPVLSLTLNTNVICPKQTTALSKQQVYNTEEIAHSSKYHCFWISYLDMSLLTLWP